MHAPAATADASESTDHLRCAVCWQPFWQPVALPGCSHRFCRRCICKHAEKNPTCPLCRAPCPNPLFNAVTDHDLAHLVAKVTTELTFTLSAARFRLTARPQSSWQAFPEFTAIEEKKMLVDKRLEWLQLRDANMEITRLSAKVQSLNETLQSLCEEMYTTTQACEHVRRTSEALRQQLQTLSPLRQQMPHLAQHFGSIV